MSAAPHSQRGAGTLMATVFLLLIVALFGSIGLRLAGTDINDTAVQNDSVEALFLAESGLERALQRLGAGTCATVAEPGILHALGRGDFEIQSSITVGSLCRVQVLGRVLLGGAMSAQRQIEGDLSLGGCRGWAVGNANSGEVFLCWNGSSWIRNGPYLGIPDTTLRGVTCPAANDCWAVGNRSGGDGLIAHWDGSTWTLIGSIPNVNLYGVHCYDSDTCWAVGNNRTFLRWDGSTWAVGPYAFGFPNTRMNSVYCAADLDCWAVGDDTGGEVIAHWTGGNWSRIPTTLAIPNAVLRGIACANTSSCWAVGDASGGDNFNRWDGTNWSHPSPYPLVPSVRLNGVHCLADDNCWAVGDQSGGELIARWDGGPDWTRSGPWDDAVTGVPDTTLLGIHMVSASEGYAVGNNGTIAAWNGSTWANQASPVNTTLRAVTMAPSGGGTVSVQRWREIIQ